MEKSPRQRAPQERGRFQNRRNEICRFFAAGNCAKGADCSFTHGSIDFEANPQEGRLTTDGLSSPHESADATWRWGKDSKVGEFDSSGSDSPVVNAATCVSLSLESAAPLSQKSGAPCENCGMSLNSNFRFCTECGWKVGDTLKTPPQSPCHQFYDAQGTSPVSDDGLLSYDDASLMIPVVPYPQCGSPTQAVYMGSLPPVFLPSHDTRNSARSPVVNEVLHELLEDMVPGLMMEMKKSSKVCESMLLQAMPDHYDD